jgi:hypothetical protein
MAEHVSTTTMEPPDRERRERWGAWAACSLGCLYCGWMGLQLWRSTGAFGAIFEGLGAELPTPTHILMSYRNWIYPGCFGGFVALLVAKELVLTDKRLTAMLTMVITIGAQFLGHWMMTVYYLPLFELVKKLG